MGHYYSEMESDEDYSRRQKYYNILSKAKKLKCKDLTVEQLLDIINFINGRPCSYVKDIEEILSCLKK